MNSYVIGCDYMKNLNPKIPKMMFPNDMEVQPLVPINGATLRFRLNGYSVYLDNFNNLGSESGPYWEVFDGVDCHRFDVDNWSGMLDFVMSLG